MEPTVDGASLRMAKMAKPMANAIANLWQTHGKPMASRWQTHAPFPYPYPKRKEKEEYSSSFSKEIGVSDFELMTEKAHANAAIIRDYPNLDLSDAWNAFLSRHYGENRTIADWTRLWKGWCQRRARMSGIPPSKRHVHTWKCSHVLEALGRDEETAQADEKACELADRLNKEES